MVFEPCLSYPRGRLGGGDKKEGPKKHFTHSVTTPDLITQLFIEKTGAPKQRSFIKYIKYSLDGREKVDQ